MKDKNSTEILEQEKQKREKELLENYEARLERIRNNVANTPKAKTFEIGSVKIVDSSSFGSSSIVWTFIIQNQYSDLLNWQIDSEKFSLDKSDYYFSFIKETGRLAWGKVNKTRVTQFAFSKYGYIDINDNSYYTKFSANKGKPN